MKKEFGKWIMDVAKYITTAVLLATVFNDISNRLTIYYTATFTIILMVGGGLWLLRDQKKEDKK